MEWLLVDAVKVEPRRRTKAQWRLLGQHHAQALVARRLPQMNGPTWRAYFAGVLAGAVHESEHARGREITYWMAYVWTLQLTVDDTPRVLGTMRTNLRVVA